MTTRAIPVIKRLMLMAVITGSYVGAAKLGFLMAIPPGNVTAVWPPSGIALAAVLLLGRHVWFDIWLGSFLANVWFFANLSVFSIPGIVTSSAIATGSTLQAFLGAFLIRKWTGVSFPFDRSQDVFKFAGIDLVACTVAATIGVTALFSFDYIPSSVYIYTWLTWWLGDIAGILTFTPVILILKKRPLFIREPLRILESVIFLILLCVLSVTVFRMEYSLIYGLIPFISWAAFRFGQHGVAVTGLLLSILAVFSTSKGLGPFVKESLNESFLLLEFFIGNVIITGLVLAAVLMERMKMEQTRADFISTISHELRTPLTAIKGSLEIVDQFIPENFSERNILKIAVRNAERLKRLVNNILDSQRLESGKIDFIMKPTEVMPLIDQAIESNRFLTDPYGVKIVLDKTLPGVKIYADSDRIIQVLNNLISNAVKFSSSGRPIYISVLRSNQHIRFTITDSGPGIPPELQKTLFQKFSQSGYVKKGTGLGLWISKMIVEHHAGSIGYETNSGNGTVFYFDLPEWQKGTTS
jgi:signal transduction histidine kinase